MLAFYVRRFTTNPFAFFMAFMLCACWSITSWGQTSYTSTSATGAWNTSRWNNSADGPTYASTYTANQPVSFTSGTYTFAGMGAATNVGNIDIASGVTVNFASTGFTILTNGSVRTITVGSGGLFNTAAQAISLAAGTGFIKTGSGAWLSSNGNAFPGGFTLNSGTMLIGGVNAMGGGGALVLNGGCIAATTGNRDFTNRYSGITIGGNIQFGDVGANFSQITADNRNLTFANNVDLGGATRTFTIGNGGNTTFQGVVSNGGLIIEAVPTYGTGGIVFNTSANTFDGTVTVNSGRLTAGVTGSLGSTVGNTTVNNGGCLRFGFAAGNSENFIINGHGTTDGAATGVGALRCVISSGNTTLNGSITLGSAASIESAGGSGFRLNGGISGAFPLTIAGNIGTEINSVISQITSLTKDSSSTLLLTAQNTYSGLTTVKKGTLRLNRTGGATLPSTNDIVVNAGGTLQISSNQILEDLDLSGGGNLTVDAGAILTITGTYTPGSGTINNLGTIVLNGIAAQNFPGASTVINNGTAGTLTNLTIDNSNGVSLNNSFTVAGTLTLTAGALSIGSNTLTLNGAVSGTGTISGSSTSNLTIGGTAGTINFTSGARSLNNLTISSGQSATLGTALDVYGALTFTGATLDLNSQVLTIKSTSTNTARVADLTGSTLSNAAGFVTVERYIPAKRAWRLLTAPLSGGSNMSVFDAWQNGGSVVANTGVEIWHPSGGTGVTMAGNSSNLRTFDVVNNAWVAVTNTQTTNLFTNAGSAANNAFLIFPTGPYNGTGAGNDQSASPAITTLRATGTLQTGTQTFSIPDAAFSNSEKIQLIGNPYASPVNFNLLTRTNVTKRFWAWDPQLSGVGGYVLVSDLDDDNTYTVTPGGSTQTQHIQSGQGFFVEVNNTGASLVFNEDDKSTSNINTVFRTGTGTERLSIDMINPNDGLVVDGILAEYNNNFSNGVAAEDGQKLFRSNENFYLTRNTKPLMLEGRKLIDNNDTLFLTISGMQQQAYRFAINGSNFANDANLSAFLKDKFLSTETAISLSGATEYNFTVTADNNSKAADRFMVVFRSTASLPVTLTNVKAYQQNSGITVEWNTQSESGMQQYEVEKSANGTNFVKVNITAAKSGTTNSYNFFDATPFSGANYYRIKAISLNGEVKYSSIVVVRLNTKGTKVTLYPNPVKGSTIQLQLSNLEKGNYSVTLFNQLGQQVMSKTINHNGGSSNQTIEIGTLASGVYELRLSNGQTVITQKLIKE
jgi:autotransporter-associated beta strand protein